MPQFMTLLGHRRLCPSHPKFKLTHYGGATEVGVNEFEVTLQSRGISSRSDDER
jgi:hypothetical protein